MSRWVRVRNDGPDPNNPVEVSLLPERGGQVTELRMTRVEMIELAKALDLMCSDPGLIEVHRKPAEGRF